jgi:hypothetical protein
MKLPQRAHSMTPGCESGVVGRAFLECTDWESVPWFFEILVIMQSISPCQAVDPAHLAVRPFMCGGNLAAEGGGVILNGKFSLLIDGLFYVRRRPAEGKLAC